MKNLNSNFVRRFNVQLSEGAGTSSQKNVTVERLTESMGKNDNDFEFIYAIQSYYLDEVLDLKKGENMFFQPNRDDPKSKGIITRVA